MTDELTNSLLARAFELGFSRAGVAEVRPLEEEGARLRHYVDEGRHGSMDWLAKTAELRADPTHDDILPSARSVLVLARSFLRREPMRGPTPGRVARYAQGRDYHNLLSRQVRKLAKSLRAQGHDAYPSVDSRPVYERAWAERAGVGFIGKNCCLIVPGLGSHVFLACVLTSAELTPSEPIKQRCGSCRACLDACPTNAFVSARELDARRCVSYLTIEHEGAIDAELRPGIEDWLFGCDACQDVCPFNKTQPDDTDTEPFAPHARLDIEASDLLTMSDERFSEWSLGSPMRRAGRARMARNAALVLGNRGTRRHLPILEQAGVDPDPDVGEAAAWAVTQIATRAREDEER